MLILGQRFRLAGIKLIPTVVQGDTAADSIVSSLRAANSADVDLIILGRGGGSLEDLWCFNEEAVAREVFASRVPVISAVGHETDCVLTDFVADARAATPSHAAELAVPDSEELTGQIETLRHRVLGRLRAAMQGRELAFQQAMSYPALQRPELLVDTKLQQLDDAQRTVAARAAEAGKVRRGRLEAATTRLAGIDRRAVLRRGYAIRSEYVAGLRERLEDAMSHPLLQRPQLVAGARRGRLERVRQMVGLHGRQFGKGERARLERINARLEGLDPEAALRRGYSIVRRADDGSLVTSVGSVARGDGLAIAVTDGEISADVSDVEAGG
jgi:exodeoxyribonuclease VII large subunit